MLSILLLFVSSLAYNANKCDCHLMLGFLDGEKVCDALNICSASDVDLNLMELAPLYIPTMLSTPGLQLTNVISSESLTSGLQDDKYCTLCENVVKKAEDELPTIEPKLEQICSRLNSTVKTLLCQKAIKKVFEEIENIEPETICEKVKLCNSTSIIIGEEKKAELPNIDFCSICEKVVKKAEDELPTIEPKLEQVCSRLNSTVKTLLCQKAIQKAFEEIENIEPETICEKVKLCNSTSIITGEEKKAELPNVDFCAACEKVWNFAQAHDDQIKTVLDTLCQKLGSATKDKACEFAVNYLTSWIDSHSAQEACADVHLCNSTSSLHTRILS